MAWIYVLLALTVLVYTLAAINFFVKIRRFKIIGTTYLCVVFAYLLCVGFSLYANLNPVVPPETPAITFATPIATPLSVFTIKFFILILYNLCRCRTAVVESGFYEVNTAFVGF